MNFRAWLIKKIFNVKIKEISRLTVEPNEVLLVRLQECTSEEARRFHHHLKTTLGTERVVTYSSDNIEFLKIQLKEKLIDQLIDDELQK